MMELGEVLSLYKLLTDADIDVWLDGGWGVDALLGEQTRQHEDLDIVCQEKDLPKLRKLLEVQGYKDMERDDTSAWNFVLGDSKGNLVDVHAFYFDKNGKGIYGNRGETYPPECLKGVGKINGQEVKCITAEQLVKFISPWLYKRREKDLKDVAALCEKFGIDLPQEYQKYVP